MVTLIDSGFDPIYSNDTYLLATLLDPRYKVKFLDTATTQSAIDRLIQQACESYSDILPMEQGHQQDELIQPDDDDQGNTSGPCNSPLSYSQSDSTSSISTEPTSNTKKKGFSVYMILIKKLY